MPVDRTNAACHILSCHVLPDQSRPELRDGQEVRPARARRCDAQEVVGPWSYQAKTARGVIALQPVEYRILRFLAACPYRAFTRRRIAEAVSTEREPVTAETLGRYVASLRAQLGFYGDYIQSVPYVGYRFKA